jgi:phage terminase large subunit-like protein
MKLVSEYEIFPLRVGYDRYCAQYLIQELEQNGFICDDVYQGENLTPIIRTVEGTMKDGDILIGDNDLLKAHFLNSALKVNSETERMKLVKVDKNAHIDGMASFLDAMTMRDKWHAEIGEQLKND